jgi:hypothetical protein
MLQRAKKRVGRPRGRKAPPTPVLSQRVPQELYDVIKDRADAAGHTMGQEMVWRVRKSYEDEKAQADARTILASANAVAKQIAEQSLHAAMRAAGYTEVRGINGSAWFERGVNSIKWIADSLPQDLLEELLTRAATRAVKLAREGEQS